MRIRRFVPRVMPCISTMPQEPEHGNDHASSATIPADKAAAAPRPRVARPGPGRGSEATGLRPSSTFGSCTGGGRRDFTVAPVPTPVRGTGRRASARCVMTVVVGCCRCSPSSSRATFPCL
jgi:hypothetical protein